MGITSRRQRPEDALAPGFELHWYEIRERLGQGGFGVTYLAHDKNLAHEVAIKEFMPAGLAVRAADKTVVPASPDRARRYRRGLDRFLAEARTLAQFRHPNIIRVRNVFEFNNTAYMVMDYELGESLRDILRRRKILDERDIQTFLFPVMEGVRQVHAHGFIHGHIKPGNIFIRVDGDPVLLDFGSARHALDDDPGAPTGTPARGYAPIEQYEASPDNQGPWTDIYGLGATLYRAIAGIPPAAAPDRSQALGRYGRDSLMPAREVGEDRYSPALLKAVDQALRFKPEDRPATISEWMQTLLADTPAEGGGPDTGAAPGHEGLARTLAQAQAGDAAAQSALAYLYARGIHMQQDEAEAAAWYRRAAEQGHINAQFNLGVMYAKGRGVKQDFRQACHWYSEAATQGDAAAQASLYLLYSSGVGVERDPGLAFEWCELAAGQGHLHSMYRLGELYRTGTGTARDLAAAFYWFREAAGRGHIDAQLNLAYMYGKGQGVGRDDVEAFNWYRQAAEAGNPQAQYNLGVMYARGRGIRRDPVQARTWYEAAAGQGNDKAERALARLAGE